MNFNITDALACAESASLAYDKATIESPLAHVLIEEFDSYRHVNFRGTFNILDWLTDAKIRFEEFPKGSGRYVHSGFLESMMSVGDRLHSTLLSLSPKPTYIGGHSKGAAEARLFIYGFDPANLIASYTFGEPRSMSRAASLDYDRRYRDITFRSIHEEDFVARIPWLCGRYRAAGHDVFLPSIGGYKLDPSLPFKLASNAYGLWKAWNVGRVVGLANEPLKDHFMANYLSAMRTLRTLQTTTPLQPTN